MDTLLRMILYAISCLAVATALSWSYSKPGQHPPDTLSSRPQQPTPAVDRDSIASQKQKPAAYSDFNASDKKESFASRVLSPLPHVHSLYDKSIKSLERELEAAWEGNSAHEIPWISEIKQYVGKANWFQQGRDGSLRWDRAASLATFVELCQPKDMLEIGSFLGLSSNFYLRLMEPWGGHLTSVDPNVRHRVFDAPRDIFKNVNKQFKDRLHTHDAFWMAKESSESGHWDYENLPPFYDKATIQTIFDERKVLTPNDFITNGQTFDMAYIDGAHDYDSVKSDFENVLSVMRPGSCVIFGDFDEQAFPGTYYAFMDIYKEALDSEQGLAMFGDQTALFIDRGFIANRTQQSAANRNLIASQNQESVATRALSSLPHVHSLYDESIKRVEGALKAAWEGNSSHDIPWISDMKEYIYKADWIQQGRDGSIRWDRAASLATFVELCQPKDMLEIGSFLGLSSNFYLRLMEPWGGHLTSVDPNVRHRVFDAPRDIFKRVNNPFKDRFHTYDAFWMSKMSLESGHWDYANLPPFYDNATIQAIFDERKVLTPKDFITKGQTFDMAFIDGAMDYDSVRGDFENVLSVMRPGSCVIFDDFDEHAWPGTYNAFMDIYKEALDSEQGLALFGDQTVLFIDRGFIASRTQQSVADRDFIVNSRKQESVTDDSADDRDLIASQTQESVASRALSPLPRVHSLYNKAAKSVERELEAAWQEDSTAEMPWISKMKQYVDKADWLQQGLDGSIRWDRAASLATFVELCQPKDMLEIGSFLGLSSNFYLRLMEPWGGQLTSVDPNVRHRAFDAPRDIFKRVNKPFKDRLHRYDAFWMAKMSLESGHWDYENLPPFYDNATIQAIFDERKVLTPKDFITKGQTFDMAFIDGAHDYDSVKGDFEHVLSVMRPGSCVIFDDFDKDAWPGTYSAFMDIYKEALDSEQGLALFGDQTALFIDRGFIASKTHQSFVHRNLTASQKQESVASRAFSPVPRVHSLYYKAIESVERELDAAWQGDSADEVTWISQMKQYVKKEDWIQQGRDGSIRWDRAASLATFVELCQPKDMLEIGSFLGLSSNFYLRLMEPWGGHLTSVDPNVRHRAFDAPRDIFKRVNKPFKDRLHWYDAFWMTKMSLESGHWDYENLPPFYDNATIQAIFDERKVLTPKDFIANAQTFDMAFIDGAHDYDSVRGDFENVLSVMRPGSCIIFDDFDEDAWPGTYKAFMDIYKEALDSEQGLALFGDQTALFIDRGFIASRTQQKSGW